MHLKRSLSLAGVIAVIGATAAILIATAGATPGPAKPQPKLHFTSSAAVLKYLRSHGVDTRGIVVQRGARVYAGKLCPGKAWSCTKAHRVIQFATLASSFSCTASIGGSQTYPNDCIVVQVNTTGNNTAKCIEQTSDPSPTQNCKITQTNVSGKNDATVFQLINQTSGQSQSGQQNATVTQSNGTGSNNSLVTQTIWQSTSTNASSGVNENQQSGQSNQISQTAGSGAQLSTMSQAVVQTATAKYGWTGSQTQTGDGDGSVNQDSTGVSKSYNFQNMLQVAKAKEDAPLVQTQHGPWRCCSSQGSNPNDVFFIEQTKSQFRSYEYGTSGDQFAQSTGFLDTTGHGHISQFMNQNGSTDSNSCDVNNGACSAEQAGTNGVIVHCQESGPEPFCTVTPGGPPPPPPAPPAPIFVPTN